MSAPGRARAGGRRARGLRLFLALPLPELLRQRLFAAAREALAEGGASLACTRPEELHVTVLFLGDSPPERVATLERELAARSASLAAPRLEFTGGGAFPALEAPRVLWIDVREVPGSEGRLERLREGAVAAARAGGWGERVLAGPFRPHLTVARVRRGGARGPAAQAAARLARLPLLARHTADVLRLFESRPARDEGRHLPLASFPLSALPAAGE